MTAVKIFLVGLAALTFQWWAVRSLLIPWDDTEHGPTDRRRRTAH